MYIPTTKWRLCASDRVENACVLWVGDGVDISGRCAAARRYCGERRLARTAIGHRESARAWSSIIRSQLACSRTLRQLAAIYLTDTVHILDHLPIDRFALPSSNIHCNWRELDTAAIATSSLSSRALALLSVTSAAVTSAPTTARNPHAAAHSDTRTPSESTSSHTYVPSTRLLRRGAAHHHRTRSLAR